MQFKQLTQLRYFSTARVLLRPALGADYKSKRLWDERFNCKMLSGDTNLIKSINSKIMMGSELSNLEVDVFINVAAPRSDEIAQLQEAVKTLKQFRRSLYSHTILPSTAHATCRLFIDSEKTPSLVSLLENRIDHGIFSDAFCLNLILDELIEKEQFALAARTAALLMWQEEFGLNKISDNLALYSVARYIESKTDFSDWSNQNITSDPIFSDPDQQQPEATMEQEKKEEATANDGDDEEDEEEAEYIRVPWLRNPYFDDHFDLDKPRAICGKTLSMISLNLSQSGDSELADKCQLLGSILYGKWSDATKALNKCKQSKIKSGPLKELCKFYLDNLHDLQPPSEELKKEILSGLEKLPDGGQNLSDEAEKEFTGLKNIEAQDIEQLRSNLAEWSELRFTYMRRKEEREARLKLIEEIKAKKAELKAREQYLYFYDNLKKNSLTRIEYD